MVWGLILQGLQNAKFPTPRTPKDVNLESLKLLTTQTIQTRSPKNLVEGSRGCFTRPGKLTRPPVERVSELWVFGGGF